MCLSLEHQNPRRKPLKKMSYFDRVTVSSHFLYTANQEIDGFRSPFGLRPVRQRGYGLRLLIFKMVNNGREQQSRSGSDKKR